MGLDLSVADITISLRSGARRQLQASQKRESESPSRCRSWNSSTRTAETWRNEGPKQASRKHAFGHKLQAGLRTGSVVEADLVADRFADSLAHLFGDPAAAIRAAIRLGSKTSNSPGIMRKSAGGTRVVFPAPAGASKTSSGKL